MSRLFLSTYGDGPLWDNTLLVPGYPQGFSYFRPFRYTDVWLHSNVRGRPARGNELEGAAAILSMRFRTCEEILPIREVVIRAVDLTAENHSVYFTMGPMYDFSKSATLSQATISPTHEQATHIGEALMFFSDLEPPLAKCVDASAEVQSWVRFVDLVATTKDLPVREEAKKGVYFRFQPLSQDAPAAMAELHKSWGGTPTHGQVLAEGKSYDFVFYHRVPGLKSKNQSIVGFNAVFESQTGNLECSRPDEHVSGNYQTHEISVSAIAPSGTWEELVVRAPADVKTQDGRNLNAVSLRVPVRITKSHWHRFKRVYGWVGLMWLAIGCGNAISLVVKDVTDPILIGLSAAFALLVPVAVHGLQQSTSAK